MDTDRECLILNQILEWHDSACGCEDRVFFTVIGHKFRTKVVYRIAIQSTLNAKSHCLERKRESLVG